jgi:hypothetical protein
MTRVLVAIALLAMVCSFAFANGTIADTGSATQTINVTVPSVAIVSCENAVAGNLAVVPPTDAGAAPTFSGTATTNVQYSSIVPASTLRTVTANVGATIDGLDLQLAMTAPTVVGVGTVGSVVNTSTTKLVLTTTAQNIITDIGSCYTGDGTNIDNSGPLATYNLNWAGEAVNSAKMAALVALASTNTYTVTYTIPG